MLRLTSPERYSASPAFQKDGSASPPVGVCVEKNAARSAKSCVVSGSTIGNMIGLLRCLALNIASCSRMYTAFWPARLGHSGFALFPLTPWQAVQTADFVAPASAFPLTASSAATEPAAKKERTIAASATENLLSIMVLRAPWKARNCTLAHRAISQGAFPPLGGGRRTVSGGLRPRGRLRGTFECRQVERHQHDPGPERAGE